MAYLILANGDIFEGTRFGAPADAMGELVFTTGMTGYLETLTDPSYAWQIVVQTFPLIGNYGVISGDFEGAPALRGYIVREKCDTPSNFRSEYALDAFLKANGIPGLYGIDTRRVTRILRESGVMNAVICDDISKYTFDSIAAVRSGDASEVSCKYAYSLPAYGEKRFSVALIDYGAKRNIAESLRRRGCEVTVFPALSAAEEILASDPDGIMLSNGPGDPADNVFQITQIKKMLGKKPVFGICLGHQLVSLAAGGKTYKLKFGHRGANQPVKDLSAGRVYITSQNHGYAVDTQSLAGIGAESFVNANDNSCEGMEYPEFDCFTVQFHPEACAGPHDTSFLFDRFIARIQARKG